MGGNDDTQVPFILRARVQPTYDDSSRFLMHDRSPGLLMFQYLYPVPDQRSLTW